MDRYRGANMTEIRGLTELKQAFSGLSKQFEQRMRTAIKMTANAYKSDVQDIAPYRSGTLRRSIHVEMVSNDTALVGTDLEYARRLEYGFAGADSLGRVYNQQARPYFRPPIDKYIDKYRAIFTEEMGR